MLWLSFDRRNDPCVCLPADGFGRTRSGIGAGRAIAMLFKDMLFGSELIIDRIGKPVFAGYGPWLYVESCSRNKLLFFGG
jgi:hypothetical protein